MYLRLNSLALLEQPFKEKEKFLNSKQEKSCWEESVADIGAPFFCYRLLQKEADSANASNLIIKRHL